MDATFNIFRIVKSFVYIYIFFYISITTTRRHYTVKLRFNLIPRNRISDISSGYEKESTCNTWNNKLIGNKSREQRDFVSFRRCLHFLPPFLFFSLLVFLHLTFRGEAQEPVIITRHANSISQSHWITPVAARNSRFIRRLPFHRA